MWIVCPIYKRIVKPEAIVIGITKVLIFNGNFFVKVASSNNTTITKPTGFTMLM
jgi:hypothetical protein